MDRQTKRIKHYKANYKFLKYGVIIGFTLKLILIYTNGYSSNNNNKLNDDITFYTTLKKLIDDIILCKINYCLSTEEMIVHCLTHPITIDSDIVESIQISMNSNPKHVALKTLIDDKMFIMIVLNNYNRLTNIINNILISFDNTT